MSLQTEQQVAAALHALILAARVPHDGWGEPLAKTLAPRVAAAIEAAADAAAGNAGLMARAAAEGCTVSDNQLENFVTAALDALRGGA
jgi:hypothetical protein